MAALRVANKDITDSVSAKILTGPTQRD